MRTQAVHGVVLERGAADIGVSDAPENQHPRRRRRSPLRVLLAASLVLFGIGGVAVSQAYERLRPSAAVIGGNYPINRGAVDLLDLSAHNSPTVVRSPADAANVVVVNRIDTPVFSCALHTSFDGGATWTGSSLPQPAGEEPKCFAPDAAFGPDGTLFVTFVTLQGLGNTPKAAWLTTSSDGGRTLSPPAAVPTGPLAFQVRLATDPGQNGLLYVTWLHALSTGTLRFPEPGNPIEMIRSEDGGNTWSAPARVNSPERTRVVSPVPEVGPTGEPYVLFLDLGDDKLDYEGGHEGRGGDPYPGAWHLVLARGRDGGSRWDEIVVEQQLVPTERFLAFLPPAPALAVDRKRNRVYAGFHDGQVGDSDVFVWASDDGGASFGAGERVNETRRGDGTAQYLPKLSVAPDGRLDVVYYDRRADRSNVKNHVSLQWSENGGKSFSKRLGLSDVAFDSRIGFGSERGMPDLGSRLGLVSTDRRVLAVWTDTRAGTVASNKQDLVRAVVDIAKPKGVPAPVRKSLRYGGLGLAALGIAVGVGMRLPERPSRKL